MIVALLLYFALVLAVMPLLHWAILRWPKWQWPACFLAGGVAWVAYRVIAGEIARELSRSPWAFLPAAVAAVLLYDYLQSRYRE